MREINVKLMTEKVRDLCIRANTDLGEDVLQAFDRAMKTEESPLGIEILKELKENARIGKEESVPICQDTGFAVVFVELGQDVHLVGGNLNEAIEEGVRQGYRDGYLRKSICHPFTRANTGDNTPAIIHTEVVPGDKIRLIVAPKGGGSENMSRVVDAHAVGRGRRDQALCGPESEGIRVKSLPSDHRGGRDRRDLRTGGTPREEEFASTPREQESGSGTGSIGI